MAENQKRMPSVQQGVGVCKDREDPSWWRVHGSGIERRTGLQHYSPMQQVPALAVEMHMAAEHSFLQTSHPWALEGPGSVPRLEHMAPVYGLFS